MGMGGYKRGGGMSDIKESPCYSIVKEKDRIIADLKKDKDRGEKWRDKKIFELREDLSKQEVDNTRLEAGLKVMTESYKRLLENAEILSEALNTKGDNKNG